EGDGEVRDFPGNYSQYRQWQKEKEIIAAEEKSSEASRQAPAHNQKRKLGYKEQREFEMLEKELESLEKEKKEISEKLSSANMPFEELQKLSGRIAEITILIDQKELRWLELSE
ncbi:ABC transporter ATP-binding protein, partial [Candidatus Dependentiae bacterium]|nr:ABC transporter ATP-binding protein [Candidatus Dependentiae bacterium]